MNKTIRYAIALLLFSFNISAIAQIRITEVGYNGVDYEGAAKWVELHNAGEAEVDVSNLILCDIPIYPVVNTLTVLGGGNTTIPAGGYLVVAWSDIGDTDSEVGLYKENSFGAFGEADNILDYMQYGEAGHGREGVAQTAGVWTAGEFVANPEAGMSLQLVDLETPGAASWVAAPPTPNAANDSGMAAFEDIRISEVGVNVAYEGAMKWVELHNTGASEVDITNLILCDIPIYPVVNTLTILGGGSLVMPAGGYVVLAWSDIGDADSEVGLYLPDSFGGFGDAVNMLDYMQYGEGGHGREGVAETAGVWTPGEFVALGDAGLSLQLIDPAGTGADNWAVAAATPNEANMTATSIDEIDTLPGDFTLNANYPNPFNPETSISYDLNRNGDVSLSVFDMLGQKVADLYQGVQAAGNYSVSWDGRDSRGNVVASGLYLYRLTLDGHSTQSRIMTLLK